MKTINCLLFLLLLPLTSLRAQEVEMKSITEKILTYGIGSPEIDPIFFTGRVYQGAEGYIYPYPLYDVLTEKKENKDYRILSLSNQYVDISIMPEIGGRIFSAIDKTDNYHFFYTQTGVKPALIGMLGAWLSGGVEWNIPDHHRASSYMPVNWKMQKNNDGSKTIWIGENELRHRLRWTIGISVYPDRSWVEAKIKVFNPTSMVQSMLYWANVSVHCNDDYQVIFPPDVQFGVDHHKVYFTPWPYGESIIGSGEVKDLSWWKNFTGGSRSIFAWGSQMNFLAGYDFGKDAGTVHVANRHIVSGKKFFLWGNNPNGQMWNKILSDKDGHYLELMVGAYSDNQPDYSWIAPGEVREFRQIWYPIKGIKGVKNATENAAVNFEKISENFYNVGYCVTKRYKNAKVIVKQGNSTVLEKYIDINPDKFFLQKIRIESVKGDSTLYTALYDTDGNILVDYAPVILKEKPMPKVIDGVKPLNEYKTNEELYLAGLRIDQFNNARLDYMTFYNEALKRDSMDARVNIEVGKHYIRQGEWVQAKKHLLRAQERLSHDYTVVKNTEALFYLGYIYAMTGDTPKAEESYWAATWTPQFKHRSFYELALLETQKKNYTQALELIDNALFVGNRDTQALMLKAHILRTQGKIDEALGVISYAKSIDILNLSTDAEESFIRNSWDQTLLRNRVDGIMAVQELLETANLYMSFGATDDVITLLSNAINIGTPYSEYPLVYYYQAYNFIQKGMENEAKTWLEKANTLSPLLNHPFRLEEITLFDTIINTVPQNSFAYYYRGNLLYYLGQKENALSNWLQSATLNPAFSVAFRNIGFAYTQKGDLNNALKYYDKAIDVNPNDPLLFTESDKIREKNNILPKERLFLFENHIQTILKHDDAVIRLLTLYNETGEYDKAINIMAERHFHVWEGGGQIHQIYANSHLLKGMKLFDEKQYEKAIEQFQSANQYPDNLEVAPSHKGGYGAKVYYLSGIAYETLGKMEMSKECFRKSAKEHPQNNLSDINYYIALSMRKLGDNNGAATLLKQMKTILNNQQRKPVDSYAKFGDENQNIEQSNMLYYQGLINLLINNKNDAQLNFEKALELNSGNIWAKTMMSKM